MLTEARMLKIQIDLTHNAPAVGYTDEELAFREGVETWMKTLPAGAILDVPATIDGLPDPGDITEAYKPPHGARGRFASTGGVAAPTRKKAVAAVDDTDNSGLANRGAAGGNTAMIGLANQTDVALYKGVEEIERVYRIKRGGDSQAFEFTQAEALKDAVVTDLAARTGLGYDLTNNLVKQWAFSANDEDIRSLSLQEDAAKEFGLEMSPWQTAKIKERNAQSDAFVAEQRAAHERDFRYIKGDMAEVIRKGPVEQDDLTMGEGGGVYTAYQNAMQGLVLHGRLVVDKPSGWRDGGVMGVNRIASEDAIHIEDSPEASGPLANPVNRQKIRDAVAAWTEVSDDDIKRYGSNTGFGGMAPLASSATQRKFLRAQYEATQEFLAAHGIKEVAVFRGADGVKHPKGTRVDTQVNPMESTTTDADTARAFGDCHLATMVPASRVFSTYRTGVGCNSESEIVLLGLPKGKKRRWWVFD